MTSIENARTTAYATTHEDLERLRIERTIIEGRIGEYDNILDRQRKALADLKRSIAEAEAARAEQVSRYRSRLQAIYELEREAFR